MSLSTAAPPTERHVAIALAGADGSLLHSQDPDRPFYAASTIKLHVLMAVLNAVDAGHLDLDRTEPARRTFTGVDGAPFTCSATTWTPRTLPTGSRSRCASSRCG